MLAIRRAPANCGFTLIELMVTITIAAILIAIAVPSFRSYQASQQVRSAADDLTFALNYARSEAVKRHAPITVAPVSAGNWPNGWTVAGADTLKTYAAVSGITISTPLANPQYKDNGRLSAITDLQFTIAPIDVAVSPRCVSVAPSGKASNRTGGC